MWLFPLLRWLYLRPARFRHLAGLASLALFLIAWAGMLPRLEALRLPEAWRMHAQTGSAALLALWVAGASWYYTLFRWAWYLPAALLGRGYRWITSGWRVWLLAAAGIGAAAWGFYYGVFGVRITLQDLFRAPEHPSMPQLWLVILVLAGLYLVLRSVFRDRRRIRIDSIEAFGVPEADTAGVASSLSHELLALKDLYSSARKLSLSLEAGSGTSQSASLGLNVGRVGLTLDTIVSGNPEIKLGVVSIPLKPLIQAIEKLYTGPVLACKLYHEGATWRLDAALSGGKAAQWQIRRAAPGSGAPARPVLDAMMQELAFRIFTHLEMRRLGSGNWKAVRSYTQGIRFYRDASDSHQRTRQQAEAAFAEALKEDPNFSACYYNLGIVYFQERNFSAAAAAFIRAAETGHARTDVFYALAKARQDSDPEAALRACRQVLQISPFETRAWNLLGVLQANKFQDHRQARRAFATAGALGWRRLCLSQFKGTLEEEERQTVTLFLTNLGATQAYESRPAGLHHLRQAIRLRPLDSSPRYEYVKALLLLRQIRAAVRQADLLAQLNPQSRTYAFWRLALREYLAQAPPDAQASFPFRPARKDTLTGAASETALIYTAFDAGYADEGLRKGWQDWTDYTKHAKIAPAPPLPAVSIYQAIQPPAADADYGGSLGLPLVAAAYQLPEGIDARDSDYVNWRKQIQEAAEAVFALMQGNPDSARLEQGYSQLLSLLQLPELHQRLPRWTAETGLYGTLVWICTSQLQLLRAAGNDAEAAPIRAPHGDQRDQQHRSAGTDAEALKTWQARAVQAAHEAFSRQPLRAWERSVLSLLLSEFQNWEQARLELYIGQGLESQNTDIMQALLNALWSQVSRSTSRESRRQAISAICTLLQQQTDEAGNWKHRQQHPDSWKVQISQWGWLHFWLGRFRIEQQEYEAGISLLTIAVQEHFRPDESYMALCYALNKTGAYQAAEEAFTALERRLKSPAQPETDDGGRPVMLAWASAALYMAQGYALRSARLEQARRMAADAFDRAEAWAEQQPAAGVQSEIPHLAAHAELVHGLACRAEALQLAPGAEALPAKLHESLGHLRKAAGYDCYPAAMAEIFYYTGLNTWELGKLESDAARKGYWNRRTREAWDQARKLDVRGEYTSLIEAAAQES